MEIRVALDDNVASGLQEKLGTNKGTEIAKSALTLLNWAVNEVSKGRVILSSDEDGQDIHRLAMPALDKVRPALAKVTDKKPQEDKQKGKKLDPVGVR